MYIKSLGFFYENPTAMTPSILSVRIIKSKRSRVFIYSQSLRYMYSTTVHSN